MPPSRPEIPSPSPQARCTITSSPEPSIGSRISELSRAEPPPTTSKRSYAPITSPQSGQNTRPVIHPDYRDHTRRRHQYRAHVAAHCPRKRGPLPERMTRPRRRRPRSARWRERRPGSLSVLRSSARRWITAMSPPGRGARAPDRSIPRARVMLRAGSAPVADDRSPLGTARTALSEWRRLDHRRLLPSAAAPPVRADPGTGGAATSPRPHCMLASPGNSRRSAFSKELPTGGDHRFGSLVDGLDDLGVVDSAKVSGGDREVGVTELPLDHDQ